MTRTIAIGSALVAALMLTACAADRYAHAHDHGHDAHADITPNPDRGVVPVTSASPLVATIRSVGDSGVTGVFHFVPVADGAETGVRVLATVSGLNPNSKHGCHIHAYGDASNLDTASSAGVHFNPFDHDHALPPAQHRHAGAFPNLEADAYGNATLDFTDETITLTTGLTAILGRSVIIHEKEDVGAQPWGGAGGRIAVGIVGLANPDSLPVDAK